MARQKVEIAVKSVVSHSKRKNKVLNVSYQRGHINVRVYGEAT